LAGTSPSIEADRQALPDYVAPRYQELERGKRVLSRCPIFEEAAKGDEYALEGGISQQAKELKSALIKPISKASRPLY